MGEWKFANILEMSSRRAKLSEIWDSGVVQGVYVRFLELWQMAKFHAQIWQFWKSAHILETTARRAKISSISTPLGRKRVYVQLPELWLMGKFHAQIWQFWRSPRISETVVRKAKISSISTPWGREYICNFWKCGQWPSFIPNMTILKISQYLGTRCR